MSAWDTSPESEAQSRMRSPELSLHRQSPGLPEFQTTHWSAVLRAGDTQMPGAAEALDTLCRAYWYPLYTFVRRQGYPPPEAQDLTQEFFAVFLSKKTLRRACPERGRFRSFLLMSMKNFLANQWDRSQAKKRGGGRLIFSLEFLQAEKKYERDQACWLSPEKLYERRWAQTVFDRVLSRLRDEYLRTGKIDRYEALQTSLLGEGPESHSEMGGRLGMSESAVKSALHRLRQRSRELLRLEIGTTVERAGDIDAEIRDLRAALSDQ